MGHTHFYIRNIIYFHVFYLKSEKIGFKNGNFWTDRQIETQRVRGLAEPRENKNKSQRQINVPRAAQIKF